MTPLDLAFLIEDPVGKEAMLLAVAVVELIRDRDSVLQMQCLTAELEQLNDRYPRRYVTRKQRLKLESKPEVKPP